MKRKLEKKSFIAQKKFQAHFPGKPVEVSWVKLIFYRRPENYIPKKTQKGWNIQLLFYNLHIL